MKGRGTSRRRVKVVRERPSKEVLDAIVELQMEVGVLKDAFKKVTAYVDLVARRIDGLEAKLAAEKMREAVKW